MSASPVPKPNIHSVRTDEMPPELLEFCARHGIDARIYENVDELPRFVRINPRNPVTRQELEQELWDHGFRDDGLKSQFRPPNTEDEHLLPLVQKAPLSDFFQLDGRVGVARLPSFRSGRLYGMDAASAIAVLTLDVRRGHHVLDLCCAPGMKLCMMADTLSVGTGAQGSVTGVDVSEERLNSARSLVRRHELQSIIRLRLHDGRTFQLPPPTPQQLRDDISSLRPRMQRRYAKKRRKLTEQLAKRVIHKDTEDTENIERNCSENNNNNRSTSDTGDTLYDRVLVDAECTHDGSVRHIAKFAQWGWDTFRRRVLEAERGAAAVQDLQLQLLRNGFSLLKPGGVIVYSTCSFTRVQNEGVVERFLELESDAVPEELPLSDDLRRQMPWHGALADPESSETARGLQHVARFDPVTSNTSGLFVARFRKQEHLTATLSAQAESGSPPC
ncbi:MAG: hypothetical protein MHM6MM_000612 [Cercozoa sp. M6MM]